MKCLMMHVCSSLTQKTFCAKIESNIQCGNKNIFACPSHKIHSRLRTKNVASPLLIKCHVQDHNHPEEEDDAVPPLVSSDWRAFRAKLVSAEQQPSGATKLSPILKRPAATGSDPHSPAQCWAHPIHEPERGCLLVATEKLDGVHIFERAVILMLSTSVRAGMSGVILNRPSLMSIKEMSRTAGVDSTGVFANRPLFFGGPLGEGGLFLASSPQAPVGSVDNMNRYGIGAFDEVMSGLYYGTKESVGCAAEMVRRKLASAGDFHFFDGYCRWERDQLGEEIRAGYWRVVACSTRALGLSTSVGVGGLWGNILGLMASCK